MTHPDERPDRADGAVVEDATEHPPEDTSDDDTAPAADDAASTGDATASTADAAAPAADPRIAEALERLQGLGDRPPEEHVEVYEDVHRVLAETLSEAQQDRAGGAGA